MKYLQLIFVFSVLSIMALCQEKNNPLLNTQWKFKGYIYNKDSTLEACPPNVNYTIEFKDHHKVSGVASLVEYWGTYKS